MNTVSKEKLEIYKMNLHEEIAKPSNDLDITIIRVAGGWIYANKIYDTSTGYCYLNNMVFVPFSNEFQDDTNT